MTERLCFIFYLQLLITLFKLIIHSTEITLTRIRARLPCITKFSISFVCSTRISIGGELLYIMCHLFTVFSPIDPLIVNNVIENICDNAS